MKKHFDKLLSDGKRYEEYSNKPKTKCYEDAPKFESMRKKHIKNWGGKVSVQTHKPIENFLKSRLGKKWDDVYSELRQAFKGSKLEHEVYEHELRWLVDIHTYIENKVPYDNSGREISGYYVHPDGTLKHHCKYSKWRRTPVKDKIIEFGFENKKFFQHNNIWYRVEEGDEKDAYWCHGSSRWPVRDVFGVKINDSVSTYGRKFFCKKKESANKGEIKKIKKLLNRYK